MEERQIVVRGEHIALCPMLPEDQPHFHRWLIEQPALRRSIDDPNVPTPEDQERWFQRSKGPDRCFFSLITLRRKPGGLPPGLEEKGALSLSKGNSAQGQARGLAPAQLTVPNQVLIGNAGYADINPEDRTAQFRITIGRPEYRGKGLGREATELLLRYGFTTMGLKAVWLRVRKDNAAARAVYEKVGFRVREEYPAKDDRGAGVIMEISPV